MAIREYAGYKFDDKMVLVSITAEDLAYIFADDEERPTQGQFDALCDFVNRKGTSDYVYENMGEWVRDDWRWLKNTRGW